MYSSDKYVYGNLAEKPKYATSEKKKYIYSNNAKLAAKSAAKRKAKKMRLIATAVMIFIAMFAVLACRNAQLAEVNYQVQEMSKEVAKKSDEKAALIVKKESLINPDIVRTIATKKLKMHLPTEKNKVFVSVKKSDFSISCAQQEQPSTNVFAMLFDKITSLL